MKPNSRISLKPIIIRLHFRDLIILLLLLFATKNFKYFQFLKHITESQKEFESRLAEIHQQQEISRQKFSEQLYKTEAEMEASIVDVLKNIQAHRDQKQLQELVKAEENQSHSLLALKLEEFKNLRKEDILSKKLS